MKIKFNKRQTTTILTLYAAIAILLCGMFFLPWVNPAMAGRINPPDDTVPVETKPHDPFRTARFGIADSAIEWETNLGGTETDTVVAAYPTASGVLIFGNTNSTDYDFTGGTGGYFVILLGFNGTAINYLTAEGTIAAIEPVENGFLLCVNTDEHGILIHTDALGNEKKRIILASAAQNETLIAVYIDYFVSPDNEPYHAVVQYIDADTKNRQLRIHILTNELKESYKRWFPRAQDLSFITAYTHLGGFYLFANIKGETSSILTYYTWTKNSSTDNDRKVLNLSLIDSYTCDAVMPTGVGRYALLIRTDRNIPYLVDCTQNFTAKPALYVLSDAPAEKTALLTDGTTLYAYLYSVGDVSEIFRFNETFSVRDEISGLRKLSRLYCHTVTERGTLFCGQTTDSVLIAGINQNGVSYERSFQSKNETVKTAVQTDNALILVGTSSATSLNIGGNFGKSDIWVAKVLL